VNRWKEEGIRRLGLAPRAARVKANGWAAAQKQMPLDTSQLVHTAVPPSEAPASEAPPSEAPQAFTVLQTHRRPPEQEPLAIEVRPQKASRLLQRQGFAPGPEPAALYVGGEAPRGDERFVKMASLIRR